MSYRSMGDGTMSPPIIATPTVVTATVPVAPSADGTRNTMLLVGAGVLAYFLFFRGRR